MKYSLTFLVIAINLFFLNGCSNVQQSQRTSYNFKIYPKSESEIRKYFDDNYSSLDPIEGFWSISSEYTWNGGLYSNSGSSNDDNWSKVAIIKSDNIVQEEFIEVAISDIHDSFKPGSVSAYFYNSAYKKVYISTQLSQDGSKSNVNFFIDDLGILQGSKDGYNNGVKVQTTWRYMKLYPKNISSLKNKSRNSSVDSLLGTGSGFFISSSGLIITNYHVVVDGTRFEVIFPSKGITKTAKVKMKDVQNDIAILEIENFNFSEISSSDIPYTFADATSVRVGQEVFTLGFPLGDIMGTTPRLANGNINSLYGLQDDPRLYQINNPIQPGNSGGALFNRKGELVGICVSGLSAQYFYENLGIIPQNMNFAIKATYLKNLISMLPDGDSILKRLNTVVQTTLEDQIEQLSPFVVQIRVY